MGFVSCWLGDLANENTGCAGCTPFALFECRLMQCLGKTLAHKAKDYKFSKCNSQGKQANALLSSAVW